MSDEVPLGGGWSTGGVVRVGDTVRRPQNHATQLMRDVLVHLAEVGFDAAPRWLGLDERGRDVLTFVEGETFSDTRRLTWSDGQLAACRRAAPPLPRCGCRDSARRRVGGRLPRRLRSVEPDLGRRCSLVRHRLRQRSSPARGWRTSAMRSGSSRSRCRRSRSFAGTGCRSTPRDAVDYASSASVSD